jgi:hypothetical protein
MGGLNCCNPESNDKISVLNMEKEKNKLYEKYIPNYTNFENINTDNSQNNILNTKRTGNNYDINQINFQQYFTNQNFDMEFFKYLKSNSIDEISKSEFEKYIPEKISSSMQIYKDNDLYIKDNPIYSKYYYIQNEKNQKTLLLKTTSSIYKGDWMKNSLNTYSFSGKGIYYSLTKNYLFDGIWNNNKFIFGRIYFINGNLYEGPINNNKANGFGRYIDSKGINYFADFINNKMTGDGLIKFPNSIITINGIYDNNETITGHNINIIFISQNKEHNFEYIGGVKENILNGFGTLTSNKYGKYIGNFYNNFYNGNGKIIYPNNIIFEGNFHEGNMIKGIFNLPNGSILYPNFINGKINDLVKLVDKNNNEFQCEFKNGEYVDGSFNDKNKENKENEENEKLLKEFGNVINSSDMFTSNFYNSFGLGFFYQKNGKLYTSYGNDFEKLSDIIKSVDFNI